MVTVYSKENCQGCRATVRFLETRGIEFHYKDVTNDEELQDSLRADGWKEMPVVESKNGMWSGYRPDLLGGLVG